ncbi:tetratricopeptide repeat protein [Pseudomonas sp. PA27(2017)]|uniref:tetratricopeptide repeat protein n=1 Tax=Pseudomonas sp. PA27(2017) TaxID=1932112 RepID=UPI001115124F|nr:tetratricopeptide repeat protein [Pseudomonas sp. PA27(2017)]
MPLVNLIFLLFVVLSIGGCNSPASHGDYNISAVEGAECLRYLDRADITVDEFKAVNNFASTGNYLCRVLLASWYERGIGVPINYDKAREVYQSAADANPAAYVALGRMAKLGRGQEVDYVLARQLYKRASDAGSLQATVELGKLMEGGEGGAVDPKAALDLYISKSKKYGDEAWIEVRRLRSEGMTLELAQEPKYNQLWLQGLKGAVGSRIYKDKLWRLSAGVSSPATAKVRLVFMLGSNRPEVSIAESSGYPSIDEQILASMSLLTMTDDFLFPKGETFQIIVAPVVIPEDEKIPRQ